MKRHAPFFKGDKIYICSENTFFNDILKNRPISNKPWVTGIQVFTNQSQFFSQKGDQDFLSLSIVGNVFHDVRIVAHGLLFT